MLFLSTYASYVANEVSQQDRHCGDNIRSCKRRRDKDKDHVQGIPVATNIATAELLVKALVRGDFSWRELVHKYKPGVDQ